MWYSPKLVECKECKRELNQQEFPFNESLNRFEFDCYDCRREKTRIKNGTKRISRVSLVKPIWNDAIIKLSNRTIIGRRIQEEDLKQIIDEGYFFILTEKTMKKI
jgi:hypothetical protein